MNSLILFYIISTLFFIRCNTIPDKIPNKKIDQLSDKVIEDLINPNKDEFKMGYSNFPLSNKDKKNIKSDLKEFYGKIDMKNSFKEISLGAFSRKKNRDIQLQRWGNYRMSQKLEEDRKNKLPEKFKKLLNGLNTTSDMPLGNFGDKTYKDKDHHIKIWIKMKNTATTYKQMDSIGKPTNQMFRDNMLITKALSKLNFSNIYSNKYHSIINMHIQGINNYYKSLSYYAKTNQEKKWIKDNKELEGNFFKKLDKVTDHKEIRNILEWLYTRKSTALMQWERLYPVKLKS